ncbi:MAG: hypothetical protein JWN25_966 [Verrucomicrobiales bacterium]|nr:hypothetical protein [Verrucomicrobiales bacterium]
MSLGSDKKVTLGNVEILVHDFVSPLRDRPARVSPHRGSLVRELNFQHFGVSELFAILSRSSSRGSTSIEWCGMVEQRRDRDFMLCSFVFILHGLFDLF